MNDPIHKTQTDITMTYSGISPLGTTILMMSFIKENFMIRSADVVADKDGDAFT